MKKIIVCFLISYSSLSFAQSTWKSISYVVQESSVVTVKQEMSIAESIDILLSRGDVLVFLGQQEDEQGQLWWHIGKEPSSFVEDESNISDFWVNEENLRTLFLYEEILGRMTYCYRYVKKYLLNKGFVKTYLPGTSAYMAATVLPKYGFVKSARLPRQAITYDVCVYKGGPSGHGHIEVLDPRGWYYGYGYFKKPISNRTFLGCFYKAKNMFK